MCVRVCSLWEDSKIGAWIETIARLMEVGEGGA